MLVIGRTAGQSIIIGDPKNPIGTVTIVRIKGKKVRLAFDMRGVPIIRNELNKRTIVKVLQGPQGEPGPPGPQGPRGEPGVVNPNQTPAKPSDTPQPIVGAPDKVVFDVSELNLIEMIAWCQRADSLAAEAVRSRISLKELLRRETKGRHG